MAQLYGLTYCADHNMDPHTVFCNQFFFSERDVVGGDLFHQERLGKWTLYHGAKLPVTVMKDRRGRKFGVFLGHGVDADGQYVDEVCFAGFDMRAKSFWDKFETYVNGIAGRFMIFALSGEVERCYFDPVAHLSTVYNAKTRMLGSSVFLVIDRPPLHNPKFQCDQIHFGNLPDGVEPNYILGHTLDTDVRFVLPNHRLDLSTFMPERIWPLPDSFAPATPDRYDAVIDEMVTRQRQILDALVDNQPCVLPVSGGTDSRKLLACLSHRLDDLKLIFGFQHTPYSDLDVQAGEYIVDKIGGTYRPFTIAEADAAFPMSKYEGRRYKRTFWLRTSQVSRPTPEYIRPMFMLQPKDCLHLRGNVMDLTRAIWWRSFSNRHAKLDLGLKHEIGNLFLMKDPSADIIANWAEEYLAWKHGLPDNARELAYDFIFLELFLHVSATKYYAYGDNFYINPFSDRRLIELTLSLPVDYRFGADVNESFIAMADSRLAGLPYRKGVEQMIKRGEWTPPSLARRGGNAKKIA